MSLTKRVRTNLELLAAYLEALPEDYEHFDMATYIDHDGSCDIGEAEEVFAKNPDVFLNNCGAVACALGHAPAAGIPLAKKDVRKSCSIWHDFPQVDIEWGDYAKRNFFPFLSEEWRWCFSENWGVCDNHHYGAAARIRYLLAGKPVEGFDYSPSIYAEYRHV